MNELTVMHAYDEFGDDGDKVDKKDDKIEETKSAKDTTSEVEVVADKEESEVESTRGCR